MERGVPEEGVPPPSGAQAELSWADSRHIRALQRRYPSGFDTIVTSDTLYYRPEQTYDALASTIRALAAADAQIVLGYMVRHGSEERFVDLLTSGGTINGDAARDDDAVPRFEVVWRNAADEFSRTAATHAPRVVELRRCA